MLNSKTIPCLAIDLTVASSAPSQKRIGINYYPHSPHPAVAQALIDLLGFADPLIECPGKISGVFKNNQQAGIILASIPRDSDNLNP